MDSSRFLTVEEVLQLHTELIEQFGGAAGIRDIGLIESAVNTPQQTFSGAYLHSGLASMAAAYLYQLAKNHGFVDGNKRIAARAATVFLAMNDREIDYPLEATENLVLSVAKGEMSKQAVTAFFVELLSKA